MAAKLRAVLDIVKPNLATFVKYAKVELTPPSPGDIGNISRGIKNLITSGSSGKWKHMTVKDAWLNVLVATEVACWFYIGEVIGRRHFVGYHVDV